MTQFRGQGSGRSSSLILEDHGDYHQTLREKYTGKVSFRAFVTIASPELESPDTRAYRFDPLRRRARRSGALA